MEKKGDLLKDVLGIIIAVLCIAGLLFLAYRAIYGERISQEDRNARHTIDLVLDKIDALQDGGSAIATIQGFKGSESWYFVGWDSEDKDKPEKCSLGDCLCVCKGAPEKFAYPQSNCQSSGFCRRVNYDLVVDGGSILRFDYDNDGNRVNEAFSPLYFFSLGEKLSEVNITKSEGVVRVEDPEKKVIELPSSGSFGKLPSASSQSPDV